ncbi:Rap1a/Tai family immunity protein [Variovorax terrae]|uniref:Rap1a immunity protein domain-containing protein n=1 Tax=Variovorax terrae TaxID=2923278 RepID=A0A9X1VVI8_9BURK|nr:Rap1a/Tai family immunity protein [Variovorax terrae]MCJ0764157.1 hypothetical protein [Variovorax terrae]
MDPLRLFVVLAGSVSICLGAFAAPIGEEMPDAGRVYLDCTLSRAGAADRGELCAFATWGFMAGYAQGADSGAAAVLIHDREAMLTTRGVADLGKRLDAIRPRARCIPSDAKVADVVEAFVTYMSRHPRQGTAPFGVAAREAVAAKYGCSL